MAKTQYNFNEETLTFTEQKKTTSTRIRAFLGYIATSTFIAVGFLLLFTFVFDSPKEKSLKRENTELRLQYEIIEKQIDKVSNILSELQERDDNIYRTIFEAAPIPSTIRDAGFGGSNRYDNLEELKASKLVIDTHMKLDVITKKLYVQSKSFDEVVELVKNKEKMLMSIPSIMPIASKDPKHISSGYGYRIHPIDKVSRFHYGIDFAAATGTEIHATGNGIVERCSYSSTYGNVIVVNHGFNYKSLYAHMSGFNVKLGQHVTRGQIIGFVGNTGRSHGAHLHYGVQLNGQKINPSNYFFNDLSPEQYEEMIAQSEVYGQSLD